MKTMEEDKTSLEHHHLHHSAQAPIKQQSNVSLAFSATMHCLAGCGIGEVTGIVLGTALSLTNTNTLVLGVLLGFVFGLGLGIWPLLKANFSFSQAFKQVLITDGLSILVMETAEVLVEVYTPGVMNAGLLDLLFWIGMLLALTAGFIVAFPVNYYFVKKGIRHQH